MLKVIRCTSIIFNKKLIFKNYGFYIMLLMTFLNILFFFVSIKNNLENKLNIFTNIVLSQMKIIYNKKKNETNLIFDDDNNNDKNKNSINNKDIGIDVILDNNLRANNDNINNINDSINKENNEKINFERKKLIILKIIKNYL